MDAAAINTKYPALARAMRVAERTSLLAASRRNWGSWRPSTMAASGLASMSAGISSSLTLAPSRAEMGTTSFTCSRAAARAAASSAASPIRSHLLSAGAQ